jgi:ribosomal protein L31E
MVESCVITVDGTEYSCKVPSGAIKLIKPFVLRANETVTLTLDFDANESISETGNHTYKFQPVIKVIPE